MVAIDEDNLFRANSAATKAWLSLCKALEKQNDICDRIGSFIKDAIVKLEKRDNIEETYLELVEDLFNLLSEGLLPIELQVVLDDIFVRVKDIHGLEKATTITNCFYILRYINPRLIMPQVFGILEGGITSY